MEGKVKHSIVQESNKIQSQCKHGPRLKQDSITKWCKAAVVRSADNNAAFSVYTGITFVAPHCKILTMVP